MNVRVRVSLAIALAALSFDASAGNDPALLGCWRSQQVQMTFADQSYRSQNGDCVVEYDANHARSHCHNETGEVEILSSYQLVAPGQLRVTVVDPATGSPKGPPAELHYRIDEDWLLIDRQMASAPNANNTKQPISLKSVSVRERSSDGSHSPCEARGETGLRIGRTSKSSLALAVPPGWQPFLVDPAENKELALAVNSSFFIGAFVPRDVQTSAAGPSQFVALIDDSRSGPIPVRAAEFAAVKKRFAEERPTEDLGTFQLTCNQPDRICGILKRPNSAIYTELVNVKGRVVLVNAVATGVLESNATNSLTKSVRLFVEQLRSSNAK